MDMNYRNAEFEKSLIKEALDAFYAPRAVKRAQSENHATVNCDAPANKKRCLHKASSDDIPHPFSLDDIGLVNHSTGTQQHAARQALQDAIWGYHPTVRQVVEECANEDIPVERRFNNVRQILEEFIDKNTPVEQRADRLRRYLTELKTNGGMGIRDVPRFCVGAMKALHILMEGISYDVEERYEMALDRMGSLHLRTAKTPWTDQQLSAMYIWPSFRTSIPSMYAVNTPQAATRYQYLQRLAHHPPHPHHPQQPAPPPTTPRTSNSSGTWSTPLSQNHQSTAWSTPNSHLSSNASFSSGPDLPMSDLPAAQYTPSQASAPTPANAPQSMTSPPSSTSPRATGPSRATVPHPAVAAQPAVAHPFALTAPAGTFPQPATTPASGPATATLNIGKKRARAGELDGEEATKPTKKQAFTTNSQAASHTQAASNPQPISTPQSTLNLPATSAPPPVAGPPPAAAAPSGTHPPPASNSASPGSTATPLKLGTNLKRVRGQESDGDEKAKPTKKQATAADSQAASDTQAASDPQTIFNSPAISHLPAASNPPVAPDPPAATDPSNALGSGSKKRVWSGDVNEQEARSSKRQTNESRSPPVLEAQSIVDAQAAGHAQTARDTQTVSGMQTATDSQASAQTSPAANSPRPAAKGPSLSELCDDHLKREADRRARQRPGHSRRSVPASDVGKSPSKSGGGLSFCIDEFAFVGNDLEERKAELKQWLAGIESQGVTNQGMKLRSFQYFGFRAAKSQEDEEMNQLVIKAEILMRKKEVRNPFMTFKNGAAKKALAANALQKAIGVISGSVNPAEAYELDNELKDLKDAIEFNTWPSVVKQEFKWYCIEFNKFGAPQNSTSDGILGVFKQMKYIKEQCEK